MDISRAAKTILSPDALKAAAQLLDDVGSAIPRAMRGASSSETSMLGAAGEHLATSSPALKFDHLMPKYIPDSVTAIRSFTTEIVGGKRQISPVVKLVQSDSTLAKVYENTRQSTFAIDHPRGQGSGFLVDEHGLIATADHVIDKQMGSLTVQMKNEVVAAEVVARDIAADVALLRVQPGGKYTPLQLGKGSALQSGKTSFLVARLNGFSVMTEGRIASLTEKASAPNRFSHLQPGDPASIARFSYTNENFPGTSGGLMYVDGRVAGVHTHSLAHSNEKGNGTAIDHVKLLMDIVSREKSFVGWLGVKSEANFKSIWTGNGAARRLVDVTAREVVLSTKLPLVAP